MRTLILTGSRTEEQRAIAQAIKAALSARGDRALTVGALSLLGPHAPLSLAAALEQDAITSARAFAFLQAGGSFQWERKRKSPVYEANALYAKNLRTLIAEGEFDAILCLGRYLAEAVSHLRKTLAFSARCCFVADDFARIPFLEETALDVFFTAHESLTEPYVRRGIPGSKIVPVGIPLPAAWFREEERADARTLLSLPQGTICVLIQSASDPAAVVGALLDCLKGADARICAVTPEAAMPKNPFSARFSGEIRVVAVPPDEEVPLFRNACDAQLCGPSGAVSAAAAVSGTPLVHLPARDGYEAQTARFFSSRGMGVASESLASAAGAALALAKDPEARKEMLAAQRGVCRVDAAERIARYLHEGKTE
jgi:processive 1,2-diacylglycerol beta-glucosyltransferase